MHSIVQWNKSLYTRAPDPSARARGVASETNDSVGSNSFQDNLFEWEVELSDFPRDSLLAKDLERYAANTKRKPVITMEMKFPKDYPMTPPFVRILRPRFKFLTGRCTIRN
jgi:ubiquitin-protein ligase